MFQQFVRPEFLANSVLKTRLLISGDVPDSHFQNLKNGKIYAGGAVPFVLRVSNTSEFPVFIDKITLSVSQSEIQGYRKEDWLIDSRYYGGAEVGFFALDIKITDEDRGAVDLLSRAASDIDDTTPNAKLIAYRVAAFDSELIYFWLTYNGSNRDNILHTADLAFEVEYVVKGQTGKNTVVSPVSLISAGSWFWEGVTKLPEKQSDLSDCDFYSLWQEHQYEEFVPNGTYWVDDCDE